jgi:hypothetical protein
MAYSLHSKTPKLNALLVGKRTVPSGCKVLHVNQQGMSLQCDPDGRLLTFAAGDSVDIYLSIQHANGYNKFTIPAIVSHVDASTIDVVFHCTDPELAELIESYRSSEPHKLAASIDHRQTSMDERVIKAVDEKESVDYHDQPESTTGKGSRSFYAVLLTLFIVSLVLLGAYYSVSSINKRVNALEALTRSHTEKIAEIETQAFSSRLQDGRYASLNARMKALTDAFQSFEKRMTETLTPAISASPPEAAGELPVTARATVKPPADTIQPIAAPVGTVTQAPLAVAQAPVATPDPPLVEEKKPPSSLQKTPLSETRPATPSKTGAPRATPVTVPAETNIDKAVGTGTPPMPAPEEAEPPAATPVAAPVTKPPRVADPVITATGPWVINLLSSTDKAYVNKAMADAQSKGVDVVVTSANVKGKQYWRLQIPGFRSMAAAKRAAVPVKEKLSIQDVWIFKR